MTPVKCHRQPTQCAYIGLWRGGAGRPLRTPCGPVPPRRSRRGGHIPSFFGILMPVFAEQAWPDLHDQTVKGALLLLPSPPRIAPSQLRLVE